MSSTTPNLGLIKPAETEVINVEDINTNSDKIDVSYKNMVDQAKQLAEQIKTAQETLNNMNGLIQANKNAITQLNSERLSGTVPVNINGGTGKLPESVLQGYSGNYLLIAGSANTTACLSKNSLSFQVATQKNISDKTATYDFNGTVPINYMIIKTL